MAHLSHATDPSGLLRHPRRRSVHGLVAARPGPTARELAGWLRIPYGSLRHHLRVLERGRLVAAVREGRSRRFFPIGRFHHRDTPVLALLRNAPAARLLRAVHGRPGIRQRDLVQALARAPSTIAWHVRRLERLGLVTTVKVGHDAHYHPTDRLRDVVARGPASHAGEKSPPGPAQVEI